MGPSRRLYRVLGEEAVVREEEVDVTRQFSPEEMAEIAKSALKAPIVN